MTHTISFILDHPDDWRQLLSGPPYNLTIKDDVPYTIISYHQFESDFQLPLVRECRGLILRDADGCPEVACRGFDKFGNYGESYCPEIDWSTARVQTKVDGSIIRLWYEGEPEKGDWHVSTNGVIDATKALVGTNHTRSFEALFWESANRQQLNLAKLDRDCTYMFELVGPENRVVVYYTEPMIFHIGTRENRTGLERSTNIDIPRPAEHRFQTLSECIEGAKRLPVSEEGYVVVDATWNRVKIKSPAYVALHAMLNGPMTTERIIRLIRQGDVADLTAYFPEYSAKVKDVQGMIAFTCDHLQVRITELASQEFSTQKDFALAVKDDPQSAFFFDWRKKGTTPETWLSQLSDMKLAAMLDAI